MLLLLTGSSTGPDTIYVTVPYLIGMTEDQATNQLESVGLVIATSGGTGTVSSQTLEAFTLAPRGTTVTVSLYGEANNGIGRRGAGGLPPYGLGYP